MTRRIVSEFIHGPAGRLEALVEEPERGEPAEAVVVCHPHPVYGGTMHNKVVHRLARGLRATGSVALRFNFRGVNRSQGSWDHGRGELEDARAALGWLRARYPELPFALAGFSFGARIALELGCQTEGTRRIIAAGFPAVYHDLPFLTECRVPRWFLHGTNDEYGPRAEMEALFDRLPEPKSLTWVESRNHFFEGGLDELEQAVRALSKQVKPPAPQG